MELLVLCQWSVYTISIYGHFFTLDECHSYFHQYYYYKCFFFLFVFFSLDDFRVMQIISINVSVPLSSTAFTVLV